MYYLLYYLQNTRLFLKCIFPLILDVLHWINFSSVKIRYSSCFCYLLLSIFLCLCWNVYFHHNCLAKYYAFIKKQLKHNLFSVLISILPLPPAFSVQSWTLILRYPCILDIYIIKHIMLYFHDLFMRFHHWNSNSVTNNTQV